jgi:transcriptional regulator with XRE-family HTH domain
MSRQVQPISARASFGEMLRTLRENENMPLRELASRLEIDQSTLSKIERDLRKASEDMIDKVALLFHLDRKILRINYIGDKLAYDLLQEDHPLDILKVAEEKLEYLIRQKSKLK